MDNTLMLIVNPRAGRTRSTAPLFDAVARFGEAGYLVNVRRTTMRGDATRFVVEDGARFDRIVCYGGDGTLNEVVTGAMQLTTPPPIGYIPGGSTNDFAASLHLSDDPPAAAEAMLSCKGRALDVGSFNGRPFVYVASFGAFTKTSYSASQSVKNDLGHLAYLLEGVKDLSTLRPYRATITADGEVFDGKFLFGAITNSTSVGGIMKLNAEQVAFDDGLFELLLIPHPQNTTALQELVRSLLRRDYSGAGVIFRHVSELTVQTPEKFPWSLDGEYDSGGETARIQNLPKRLTFLI